MAMRDGGVLNDEWGGDWGHQCPKKCESKLIVADGKVFAETTTFVYVIFYGVEYKTAALENDDREVPPDVVTRDGKVRMVLHKVVIDQHAATFEGFGFLVVFLRRFGFVGIAINLLLSVFTVKWELLVRTIFARRFDWFLIGETDVVWADYSAAVILISLRALVGKLTHVQCLLLALIETVVSVATEFFVFHVLRVADIGGAIVMHLVGAILLARA
ncbi:CRE-RHR-1 protein [Aphelenchoides avenae]|nr:CRE-RHR-1 protein [Aphelenchus avenae]